MEDRRKQVEVQLIEALGSEGKIRILRKLAEDPDGLFTAYVLAKATGLRRQDAHKILGKLCQIGLVKPVAYGVTKYQINVESDIAKRLIDFFKSVEAV